MVKHIELGVHCSSVATLSAIRYTTFTLLLFKIIYFLWKASIQDAFLHCIHVMHTHRHAGSRCGGTEGHLEYNGLLNDANNN
jgi:hypothetical protein